MRHSIIIVTLALLGILQQTSNAAEKPELSIQLLTNELIMEANIDTDQLTPWLKQSIAKAEEIAAKESKPRDVAIMTTIHKSRQATIQVSARPKYSPEETQAYTKELQKITSPKSRYCDSSILFLLQANGGCKDTQMEFTPPIITPDEKTRQIFTSSSLEEKKALLQNWTKDQVIPILAHFTSSVDAKFEGVLAVGKILTPRDYSNKKNVADLTDSNSEYWRAVVEMSGGNQLIPACKIFMYVATGKFDIARKYLQVINLFSDRKNLAGHYLSELKWRLDDFFTVLNKEIQAGIALHDRKEYQLAIEHYKKILAAYPNSAWANYELYFSDITLNQYKKDALDKKWDQYKQIVYSSDPLYTVNVRASTGKEAYLLFRRKLIEQLFKDKESIRQDVVKYADIALDLQEYGFAGQLYWLIFTSFEKDLYNDRNMLAHFLYCLDKLGDTFIKQNFKGDFTKEFKKIEEQRQTLMKESTFYNVFEVKE